MTGKTLRWTSRLLYLVGILMLGGTIYLAIAQEFIFCSVLGFLSLIAFGFAFYWTPANYYVTASKREINQGNYPQALLEIEKLMEFNPFAWQGYLWRGIVQSDLKNYDLALADLTYVIEHSHFTYLAYQRRALVYVYLGNFEAALADLRKADTQWPKFIGAHIGELEGLVKISQGDYEGALQTFQGMFDRDKNYVKAFKFKANIYFELDDYQSALENYQLFWSGYTFEDMVKVGHYKLTDDEIDDVWAHWAVCYARLKNPEQAMNLIKPLLKQEKKSRYYLVRGFIWLVAHQLDKAMSDFDEVLRLDENYALAYNNRAVIHFCRGNYELALADAKRAVDLRADTVELYLTLSSCYLLTENFQLADQALEEAKQLRSRKYLLFLTQGTHAFEKGDLAQAEEYFKQAGEMAFVPVKSNVFLAITYYAEGKVETAQTLWQSLEADHQDLAWVEIEYLLTARQKAMAAQLIAVSAKKLSE